MKSLALLSIFFVTSVASAQTFRGTVLGTVTDQAGALIPGAKVVVKNVSTGLERTTTTDENGDYTVAELPVGSYEVRVEYTGFRPATISNVTVDVAGERRVDVELSAVA